MLLSCVWGDIGENRYVFLEGMDEALFCSQFVDVHEPPSNLNGDKEWILKLRFGNSGVCSAKVCIY